MSTQIETRDPVSAVESIDTELERSRRRLAAVLDRTSALAELREVAAQLEDSRHEGLPPRARQALTFDALVHVRDEETRARVEALIRRIATEEEA